MLYSFPLHGFLLQIDAPVFV